MHGPNPGHTRANCALMRWQAGIARPSPQSCSATMTPKAETTKTNAESAAKIWPVGSACNKKKLARNRSCPASMQHEAAEARAAGRSPTWRVVARNQAEAAAAHTPAGLPTWRIVARNQPPRYSSSTARTSTRSPPLSASAAADGCRRAGACSSERVLGCAPPAQGQGSWHCCQGADTPC